MDIQQTNLVKVAVLGSVAVATAIALAAIDQMVIMLVLSSLIQGLALIGAVVAIFALEERSSAAQASKVRRSTEASGRAQMPTAIRPS